MLRDKGIGQGSRIFWWIKSETDSRVLVQFRAISEFQSAEVCKKDAVYLVVFFLSFIQVSKISNCPGLRWAACYFMLFSGLMKELDQTFSCDHGLDVPGL